MNGTLKVVAPLAAALAIAACNGGSSNIPGTTGMAGSTGPVAAQSHLPDWIVKHEASPACPQVIGRPTCLALVKSDGGIGRTVAGWQPIDFQTRYKLPSGTNGAGQIVAIVDAYDNPNVASDLSTYRSMFGLGTANFTKYNQNGQTSGFPSGSTGWGLEIDLDVQMVSAVCPKCTIYLIEANGADTADLETAEDTAVNLLGAHIVSNSWICYGSDDCGDTGFSSHFDTAGVAYLASSGDAGYDFNGGPEALASVISIGGTELSKQGSTYSEAIWNGAGGGCSNNGSGPGVAKPSWQHDPDCTYRTDSDVSAVADNAAEYDSYGYSGWITVAGTSIASPLSAGVIALDGNASKLDAGRKFWLRDKKHVHRILVGNDGSCGSSYLCTAGTKQFGVYSGPGGWGSPNGDAGY